MFSTLKSAIKNIFNVDYEPNILVADCAAEITNGFSEVFELTKRVFCWAHVERAVEGHLPGKGDKEENGKKTERKLRREAILNDFRLFQKHTGGALIRKDSEQVNDQEEDFSFSEEEEEEEEEEKYLFSYFFY